MTSARGENHNTTFEEAAYATPLAKPAPPTVRWYVLHLRPSYDIRVEDELRKQGRVRCFPRHVDFAAGIRKPAPLFPGYGFVGFESGITDEAWHVLKDMPGVIRIMSSSCGTPQAVRPGFVEDLIALMGDLGYIEPPHRLPWRYRVGDRLRITSGHGVDFIGICKMSQGERIKILIDTLRGSQVIEKRSDQVELAPSLR